MFFIVFFIWLSLAARLNVEILAAGILVSAIVYRFVRTHMDYDPGTDYKVFCNLLLCIRYGLTVVLEMTRASVTVLRIVFSRSAKVEPNLVYFRTALKSDLSMVVLANSYTLAPGTVTVSLRDGVFCLHTLDTQFAGGLEESHLVQQLLKIEKNSQPVSSGKI